MKLRQFLPLTLLFSFLACDRDDLRGDAASSSTVSLAPRIVSITGAALPKVDSVRIKVVNSTTNVGYYEKSVDWNKHADTIVGIPKSTPVQVNISGVKTQADGSRVVWWSGSSNATFGGAQTIGVESFPVPVAIGDTLAPVLVSRSKDTIQTADSTFRLVWKLGKDTGLVVVVNGETFRPNGDSLVWTHPWNTSGKNTVVAFFKDAAGNVTRDSFVAVRLENVATPTFAPGSGTFLGDSAIVKLSTTSSQASIEYSTDSAIWMPYADSLVIRSSTPLWARASGKGGSSSPIAKATYVFRVASPTFDKPAGTYDSALTVVLTSATKGASIRLTLDGTEPTDSSTLYAAPVRVAATTTIKAIATKTGRTSSSVASASYVIDSLKVPVFSPIAGSYKTAQTVTISSAYKDAVIYYTTDGSIPTTSSKKYESPILVTRDTTLRAIAVTPANAITAVANATYLIGTIGLPIFAPPAGAYPSEQSVILSSATPGAVIHYTLDGTAPDEKSSVYAGPLKISATTTIRAIAMAEGWTNSIEASGTYFIGTVGAPVFAPKEGSYASEQTVTLTSATAGAAIYYTTDTTTPTKASIRYTAPIVVSAGQTIKAIATLDGATSSAVVRATYSIGFAEAPVFGLAAGRYLDAQLVALSSKTPGATIHYTTNDSTPSTTSPIYVEPIKVSSKMTIKAFATAPGMSNSPVSSAAYEIGSVGTPTFSPPAGSYPTGQKVTLSTTLADASIHYTTDGSDPTAASPKFTTPIDVPAGATIKAIAVVGGKASSSIAVAAYLIGTAEAPTFSPAAGSFTTPQRVALASATKDATIHYTLDGTTPSTSSAKYATAIPVDTSLVLKAIAVVPGMANSAVSSSVYKIGTTDAPTFNPPAGNYDGPVSIALASTTPGASIHYTLDGSDPTTSSSLFTGSIELAAGKTLKAMAVSATKGNSTISSAVYKIGKTAPPTFTPKDTSFATARGIKLASATSGAAIYYTTDGSTPTAASTPYADSILVSSGITVRAIAIAPGMAPSSATSASYTVGSAGTPTFTPASGAYPTSQKVVIASSLKGAVIYFTTDGTDPTTTSNMYTDTLTVAIGQTIKAFAVAPGVASSSVSGATYTIGKVLSPAFDPLPKEYASSQSVTLSSATKDAEIYYTINDSTPTTSSTRYTAPISVPTGRTIRAIAIAKGMANSDVAIGTYLIGRANPPSFQPAEGSHTGPQWLNINSNNDGALVYYTTDGTTPTTSSNKYTGFQLNSSDTIKAISVVNGKAPSSVVEAKYLLTAATPTFSVGTNTYNTVQNVTINSGTPGATIYYTTNGSNPTTGSNVYTGAITVASSQTIKAIAVAKGNANSQVAIAIYTINAASAPTFNPPEDAYTGTQYVTIASGTSNAAIYYTTDGSTPTNSSPKYTSQVVVPKGMTLKAIAIANGMVNSAVSSATYAITAAAPTFSPPAKSSETPITVSLSSSTPKATFYYTTDGSLPTAIEKNKYGGPIPVATGMTINAITVAPGTTTSLASSATYVIGAVSSPAFDLAQGTYTGTQTVKLTSGTAGASIYYTTNGWTPSTSSTLYQSPISVSASQTIKAIAVLAGKSNSSISEAKYTIRTTAPTFSVPGGTYEDGQSLVLRDGNNPAGAKIFYKEDNGSFKEYKTTISVTKGVTITAFAKADGADTSSIVSATYVIGKAAAPTFDATTLPKTYTGSTLVKLGGAGSIHYTTLGEKPTTKSPLYPSGGIPVSSLTTIKAIAFVPGMDISDVLTGTFAIKAAAPEFTPAGSTYPDAQSVSFKPTNPTGASILYSIDGGAFTTYAGNAFTVSKGGTIKAVATGTGIATSDTATATFTIGTAGAPTITFNAGDSMATIASNDANAIFYKTGEAITYSKYDGAFKVTGPTTVYSYATKTGAANSATETKSIGAAAMPSITFNVSNSLVSITSTDAEAIYYKTGTATTYTKYVEAFKITAATTVTAYATKTGAFNSATKNLTITAAVAPSITFNAASSKVAIASDGSGAVYYKIGLGAFAVYSDSISISAPTTVYAYATKTGSFNSETKELSITAVATPAFAYDATTKELTISSATEGASIQYKVNLDDPKVGASPVIIPVGPKDVVSAIATKAGMANSTSASKTIEPVIMPTFAYDATTKTLDISSTTTGATIHYTVNDGPPVSAPMPLSIPVKPGDLVSAFATMDGMVTSVANGITIPTPTDTTGTETGTGGGTGTTTTGP